MLYSIFVYQPSSGLLYWEKTFGSLIDQKSMNLYSSFISALHNFVQELIKNSSITLKNVEMGDYAIKISRIEVLNVDLVMIVDKGNAEIIESILPAINKCLETHKETFQNWDSNQSIFKTLDLDFLEILAQYENLWNETALDTLKLEIDYLIPKQSEKLLRERKFLEKILGKTMPLFLRKLDLVNAIQTITKKIQNPQEFKGSDLDFERSLLKSKIEKDIVTTIEKINYYLKNSQKAITSLLDKIRLKPLKELTVQQLHDVYLNVYNLATKLRLLGYQEPANDLLNLSHLLITLPEQRDHIQLERDLQRVLRLQPFE